MKYILYQYEEIQRQKKNWLRRRRIKREISVPKIFIYNKLKEDSIGP